MRLQKRRYLAVMIGILIILLSGCKSATKEPQATPVVPASDTPTQEVVPKNTSTTAPGGETNVNADLIFHNGTILTMEDGFPTAAAIAIRGERILAVGDDDAILTMATEDTQLIDLHGQTLMPGVGRWPCSHLLGA
jgi:hypothetical protein